MEDKEKGKISTSGVVEVGEAEELRELIEEGKKLYEKRSWVDKGFHELMDKINEKLSEIKDMEENDIIYTLREWEENDVYFKMCIVLRFEDDARIFIGKYANVGYGWNFDKEVKYPFMRTIREFGLHLKDAFKYFIEEIQKRNKDMSEIKEIIQSLLSKID